MENENEMIGPGIGRLVAARFPPCGCIACELKHGCHGGDGKFCTPRERKESRRIVWVVPGSLYDISPSP